MSEEVTRQTVEIARGISDYGLSTITTAFFLIISAAMIFVIFRVFYKHIMKITEKNDNILSMILENQTENTEMLKLITESVHGDSETRIRYLSEYAFKLAIEQVCRIIKMVREQNHINNKTATEQKIKRLIKNIHEENKSKFETFIFKGKPLSEYFSDDWVDIVSRVVLHELYNEHGADNSRAYTNVKMAYDTIRINFYNSMGL